MQYVPNRRENEPPGLRTGIETFRRVQPLNQGPQRVMYVRAGLQKESQSIRITNDTFELPEVSKAAVMRQSPMVQKQPQRPQQPGRQQMVVQQPGRQQAPRQQMVQPQRQTQNQRQAAGRRKYAFCATDKTRTDFHDYIASRGQDLIEVDQ